LRSASLRFAESVFSNCQPWPGPRRPRAVLVIRRRIADHVRDSSRTHLRG
jgi:hypothetical protein